MPLDLTGPQWLKHFNMVVDYFLKLGFVKAALCADVKYLIHNTVYFFVAGKVACKRTEFYQIAQCLDH